MKTIAIIGAGFSGTATAVHLLEQSASEPLRVVLINRSGKMARGVAYGTQSPKHLLNVPAGNMSALAHDPDHFLRFCQSTDAAITAGTFVSRNLYGQYLASLLHEAENNPAGQNSLSRIVGEVVGLTSGSAGAPVTLKLAGGSQLVVDRVVFAFGHFPPKNPEIADPSFYQSERYIRDPWSPDAAEALTRAKRVLLLGTGLTAVDVCISLLNASSDRVIYAVSRRGLLPTPHRSSGHQPLPVNLPETIESLPATIRNYVRAIRCEARIRAENGQDWRDVLTAIRKRTPILWSRLSTSERARFLRHVQPYWEIHRHRAAPEPYEQFQQLLLSQVLRVVAGRVLSLTEHGDEVHAEVRLRGSQRISELDVDLVVNCTGPATDLNQLDDPLIGQLLADRLIAPDSLRLGMEVSDDYAVVNAQGIPSPVLSYVGPLLRARYWEATAVPELRVHARQLAERLVCAFRTDNAGTAATPTTRASSLVSV